MLCRVLFLLAISICLSKPQLTLAQALEPPKTISLDVWMGDLHAVVSMLERQTGIIATVRDGDKPFTAVSVHLDEATLPKALRSIAQSAGAKVVRNTDGTYIFESLDAIDPTPPDSVPTQKSKLRIPLHREDLNWHTLPVHHARASDILKSMHWDKPSAFTYSYEDFRPRSATFTPGMTISPFPRNDYPAKPFPLIGDIPVNFDLPEGVGRIFAMNRDSTLLVEATEAGYQSVRQIVKILDIAAHGMSAAISYICVSENEAEIKWEEPPSPTALLQIVSGPSVTQSFDRLLKSGHAAVVVKTLHEYESREPMEWIVSGYRLSQPRLNSDDSLTLIIKPRDPLFPEAQTPPVHRGDIIAIKEIGRPDVTLIKVDY